MNTNELNNRHAYLIIAHHQFSLLKNLCCLLDHPNHDFFIHIDSKATDFDAKEFENLTKYSSIYFTERTNVIWGAYEQINCELVLLKAATAQGNYSYYHLLSGSDLPLRTAQEIYDFFESHSGKEFIHYCTDDFCQGDGPKSKIRYYHFFQNRIGRKQNIYKIIKYVCLKIQKLLRVDRTTKIKKTVCCGANWFSITNKLAHYVLENEPWIVHHFSNTYCADEFFLQMLVIDTEFYNNLYLPHPNGDYHSCMRFVDWNRGAPYTFRTEDYEELISSNYMFARKFDLNIDSNICNMITNYLSAL